MADKPARFFWYELMTTEPEAATRFYADVVGWSPEPFGGEMPYTIMNAPPGPGHGVAGIMELPAAVKEGGGRPAWLGYIHATDVDAKTKEVAAAGGTVHREPWSIPGVGRIAAVADRHGAHFMLMTPEGPDAEPVPSTEPGQVGWRELYAGDGPEAFDFYSRLFGWTKGEGMDMGPMGVYQLFRVDPALDHGGIMTKMDDMPVPFWTFYFTVPELDAAGERVKAGGGQIVNGPMEVPGGSWIIQCLDPQGAYFALVAAKR